MEQNLEDRQVPNPAEKALVATTHAVVISGLELALSLTNALDEDAFQLDTYTKLVFVCSAATEAVGFIFAVFVALRYGGGGIGGSPLIAIWEVGTRGFNFDSREWRTILFGGLLPQSVACLVVFMCSDFGNVGFDPVVGYGVGIGGFLFLLLYFCCCLESRYFAVALQFLFGMSYFLVPLLVEANECALIFWGGSTSSASYILAVLDMLMVFPAVVFAVAVLFRLAVSRAS